MTSETQPILRQTRQQQEEQNEQFEAQQSASYGAISPSSLLDGRHNREMKPMGLSWHNLSVVHPKSGRLILGKFLIYLFFNFNFQTMSQEWQTQASWWR